MGSSVERPETLVANGRDDPIASVGGSSRRANCRPLHRVKLRGRVAKVHRKKIGSAASVDCVIVGGADGLTNRCGTTHAKVDMRVLSSLLA